MSKSSGPSSGGNPSRTDGRKHCALSRVLPNIGGPNEKVRCPYMGTVRSIALYGSPIWADAPMASLRSQLLLRRAERQIAIRVITRVSHSIV